jgi:hypothetical protein
MYEASGGQEQEIYEAPGGQAEDNMTGKDKLENGEAVNEPVEMWVSPKNGG